MPIAVTMKDSLVSQVCDEEFLNAMNQLNMAAASGRHFLAMEDMSGGHVMFNIDQILMVSEVEE